jgi:hypothetical protein
MLSFELHSWIRVHPVPYSVWANSALVEVECHLFQDASGSGMLKIGVKPCVQAHHLFAMLPAHLPVSVGVEVEGSRQGSWVAEGRASWAWHRLLDTEQRQASAEQCRSIWTSL